MEKIVCDNCGMDLYPDEEKCPYCGNVIKKKKNLWPIFVIIGVVLVIGMIAGIVTAMSAKKNDGFQEKYDRAFEIMTDAGYAADEICYETLLIWYNCVMEINDEETDVYALDSNGNFYEDFNDALNNYYYSDIYNEYADYIFDTDDEVYELMEYFMEYEEKNEDKHEEELNAIWNLYSVYWDMVDLAFYSEDSYNDFYDKFFEYDEILYDAYMLASEYASEE